MEPVILFLAAFVSLVVLLAQVKMFSVDTTLREILDELRRTRHAVEEWSVAQMPRKEAINPIHEMAESSQEEVAGENSAGSEVPPKHQEILPPWQKGLR